MTDDVDSKNHNNDSSRDLSSSNVETGKSTTVVLERVS